MKTRYPLAILVAVILIVGLGITFWPRAPRGEIKSGRGSVYFFKDGFIALDTSRSPHEVYIWEIDPQSIKKVEIVEKGLSISMKKQPAEAEVAGVKIHSVGFPRPQPGRVSVCIKDANGEAGVRYVAMDAAPVQDLIRSQEWDRSIHDVLGP